MPKFALIQVYNKMYWASGHPNYYKSITDIGVQWGITVTSSVSRLYISIEEACGDGTLVHKPLPPSGTWDSIYVAFVQRLGEPRQDDDSSLRIHSLQESQDKTAESSSQT